MAAKLSRIAEEIDAFLKRFAETPAISHHGERTVFWCSRAARAGRYVYVKYISYQGDHCLTRQEADAYLDWLKAGNIGKHWQAQKSEEK